jgi:TetR/AcrR family transcriptional repressor of nem operon
MGRRKTYDRDDLVAKAMELFRDHGYAGTSTQLLVQELGVNRYSLYAEFGSKQTLFDEALRRYDDEIIDRNFGPLERPGAGANEIRTLFEFFGDASHSPGLGRGCLLCNTAVEFGPEDPNGAGFVARYFARLLGAFETALTNARSRGEIDRLVDPAHEAGFFTACVLGLFVMLRAHAPSDAIESAARGVADHLERLSTSAGPAPTDGDQPSPAVEQP